MNKVSAFTFVYNGVVGGYPFVEAIYAVQAAVDEVVVVDMQSTDETRSVLEKMDVRIIEGAWSPGAAGACLKYNHALHTHCEHDIIWHFEADEVFSPSLVRAISKSIHENKVQITVQRLQVEQNFQRIRWYPEAVHRVFLKDNVVKEGHTTDLHIKSPGSLRHISQREGYLWDVTNCFRDDWVARNTQQAELWGSDPRHRFVPHHVALGPGECTSDQEIVDLLAQSQWEWKETPLDLPVNLMLLVGCTSYREHLKHLELLD